MKETYAWLTSRYDDSHAMRESSRIWIAVGGALFIVGGGLLLIALSWASSRNGSIFTAILPVIPPWAALLAYAGTVAGCFALSFGVVLSNAAKWARQCYHF